VRGLASQPQPIGLYIKGLFGLRLGSASRNVGTAKTLALNFVAKHLAGSGAKIELAAAKALAYCG